MTVLPHPHAPEGDYATRGELVQLRREVAALRAVVAQLSRPRGAVDGRLGEVLRLIHAFAGASAWTAGELVADTRRGAPDLWLLLDELTGSRGDPAIRLGRWLEHQDGAEADGYCLQRIKREGNAWLYAVKAKVGSGELLA